MERSTGYSHHRRDAPPHYAREAPPRYTRSRRSRIGCTCDCNYARSIQGICKAIELVLLGMVWIIIAASPYWRQIFVVGGVTWPFHIVMLLSVVTWLAVLFMYCLFMSGFHLSMSHRNWPKIELYFNIVVAILVLIAACLEAANVWRWDMRQGSTYTAGSAGGAYSNYYQYGLRPGMSFTQTLNFNSYCSRRPQDCRDYFSLLAGHNNYHTNHIFGLVLLFFALIVFLVAIFFAYRTLHVFERDMHKPGQLPKPTLWMRFTYQVEQAANHVKEKANKVLKRDNEEGEDDDDSDGDIVFEEKRIEKPPLDAESTLGGRSSRSEGKEYHSRSERSSNPRSKSRSSHRHEDEKDHSSRSSTGRHGTSSSRTTSPIYEVPPSYADDPLVHPPPVAAFPTASSKKGSKKGRKANGTPAPMSPVASVMI